MSSTFKGKLLLLAFLAVTVVGMQTIRITRPFAGHFASYQCLMAAMSRNFIRENFTELLLPKTDVITAGERSLHLIYYPFPSLLAAVGVHFVGGTLEVWGRLQAIIFNLLSIVMLGLIAAEFFDRDVGWATSSIYSLSPFTLIYGQAFMSESMALAGLLFSLLLLIKGRHTQWRTLLMIISALVFSFSITGRIHFVLFMPAFILCLTENSEEKRLRNVFVFALFALMLPALWYGYTLSLSQKAANVHTNLFMQLGAKGTLVGQSFLRDPKYYRSLVDLFSGEMLTPLLFPFFFLGIATAAKNRSFWIVLGAVLFGSAMVVLSPKKVMDHDFYLFGVFPFIAIFTACGVVSVLRKFPELSQGWVLALLLLLYLGISFRFFFHPIFKYPETDRAVQRVAKFVDKTTDSDDKLIVGENSPAVMFYYANRPGWHMELNKIGRKVAPYSVARWGGAHVERALAFEKAMSNPVDWLEYLRREGASYYLTHVRADLDALPHFRDYLMANYELISTETDDFYLFRLVKGDKQ